jgi:hypothetical protein
MRAVISGFFKLHGLTDVAASCCIHPDRGSMCSLYLAEVLSGAAIQDYGGYFVHDAMIEYSPRKIFSIEGDDRLRSLLSLSHDRCFFR